MDPTNQKITVKIKQLQDMFNNRLQGEQLSPVAQEERKKESGDRDFTETQEMVRAKMSNADTPAIKPESAQSHLKK